MKKCKARPHSSANTPYWATCTHCGKRSYATGKLAKRAAKLLHDTHRDAYPCESGSGWHIGRIPTAVLRGDFTRSEWREQIAAAA